MTHFLIFFSLIFSTTNLSAMNNTTTLEPFFITGNLKEFIAAITPIENITTSQKNTFLAKISACQQAAQALLQAQAQVLMLQGEEKQNPEKLMNRLMPFTRKLYEFEVMKSLCENPGEITQIKSKTATQ